ncbi:hypothetical protein jhhlp_000251 [Lomentospora prolificans]|uniref:Poly(A) polymerase n=1 Tax=Lomentospora prolificans TaxID=41688 RepID=A0A2N3NKJ7_9PEZI|nr:hypothetical protein jhhlp_000251 [Lomentospora prolificans]
MSAADRQLGVTPPISMLLPTKPEIDSNNAMVEELRKQGIFESKEETDKRNLVLESLQKMCDEFVTRVAKEKEPGLARDARGKIFTYGGFRLGVFGPGSDIDTLVVAPKYVTRVDYFAIFPNLLIEMAPKGAITDLAVVTDAYVPIIKFEYWGISIDMIFSRIAVLKKLPTNTAQFNLTDTALLRGLDDTEIRSLNGTRVAHEILDLVPEQSTFQMALRAIKLWAQRRAIYANVMGYPGGVAWAMLVARVCQLYPRATAATIVNKFFWIVRQWPWPQPVLLKHIERAPLGYRIWNPVVYPSDKHHLMPIITPAYPSMNAAYNINRSSMSIIQRELHRANTITDEIVAGQKPWSELFEKHSFFTADYKYYLAVISSGITKDAHKKWSGFVESKVRMLVLALDKHDTIGLAQAFVKGYDRVHKCKADSEIQKVQQGDLGFVVKEEDVPKDEPAKTEGNGDAAAGTDGVKQEEGANGVKAENEDLYVYTTTHYIGLTLRSGQKSINLANEVGEFKKLCKGWEKFDSQLNAITVQHLRNLDLPDDVFCEGEVRPKRKAARPKVNGTAASAPNSQATNGSSSDVDSKKRTAAEHGAATPPAKRRQPTSVAAAG